jgi:oxygen-dependent protoporphyrinogen oxidase
MKDAVVIGAGVSGIVAAYTLKKAGFDPLVIEKEPHIGGSTHTLREDGRIIELGVQSVLGQEEFMAFAKELNLKPLHPPKEHANTRYVYLNGQLKKMPSNPIEFLTSDFFLYLVKSGF